MERTRSHPKTRIFFYAGVAALWLFISAGCGRPSDASSATGPTASPSEPVYYVDGARPSPGLNEGPALPDTEYQEGCVPWSKERPDVYICGPIAESFKPPPPPGDYADYPDVCEAAAAIVVARTRDLMSRYDLLSVAEIEVMSCGAGGIGSEQDGTWMAKFGLVNLHDSAPY